MRHLIRPFHHRSRKTLRAIMKHRIKNNVEANRDVFCERFPSTPTTAPSLTFKHRIQLSRHKKRSHFEINFFRFFYFTIWFLYNILLKRTEKLANLMFFFFREPCTVFALSSNREWLQSIKRGYTRERKT